jgi:3-mercaptopyruvate sulfurtransferase SseA
MIPGAIANDDFEMLLEQIDFLIGYEKGFVVYCSDDDCGSSEELAYELQENGFMNILVFKGGWKSWTEAGLEIEIHE